MEQREHRDHREHGHRDMKAGRGRLAPLVAALLGAASGCTDPAEPPSSSSQETEGSTTTSGSSASSTATDPSTTAPTSTTTSTSTAGVDETTAAASSDTAGSTGSIACDKNVVLMGYWPPTNEMLRPWSTNLAQNPDGWIGEDWEGYGYDVYSFFPEFPPDGDPSNDAIGEDGAVGSPEYDLRVDYQATSADFWRLVDMMEPVILVTTSRGGDIGWEIEAIEGGHGMNEMGSPANDWSSDQHGADQLPTEETIEARSWDAISSYRVGNTLPSQLPMDAILDATSALGVTNVMIDQGTSGNFLSGFLGLHGLYYNLQAPHNVAAGHIHVGYGLPVADASALIEATLHAVLQQHPAAGVACP
jgi:hypothetical protein